MHKVTLKMVQQAILCLQKTEVVVAIIVPMYCIKGYVTFQDARCQAFNLLALSSLIVSTVIPL